MLSVPANNDGFSFITPLNRQVPPAENDRKELVVSLSQFDAGESEIGFESYNS